MLEVLEGRAQRHEPQPAGQDAEVAEQSALRRVDEHHERAERHVDRLAETFGDEASDADRCELDDGEDDAHESLLNDLNHREYWLTAIDRRRHKISRRHMQSDNSLAHTDRTRPKHAALRRRKEG